MGPPVTIEPDKVLNATKAIDFIVRREFDYQIANYAKGAPSRGSAGRQLPQERRERSQSGRRATSRIWTSCRGCRRSTSATWISRRYNVPFLLNPYISFYTTRGCPAMCTFCLWPQTHSGHRWRLRSARISPTKCQLHAREFPGSEGNFLRRRHVQLSQGADAGSCARS